MALAKFSKSTGGIYPTNVYAEFPADALDIPDGIYVQFQNGTLQGALDVAGGVVVIVAPAAPTLAEQQAAAWVSYQAQAMAAIDKSDLTILRCAENAITVPAAWATYRAALRAIISAATGDPTKPLPTHPAYPAGT